MSRGAAWLPPTDLPPDDSRAVGWRRACSRSPPERQTRAAIARHEEKNSAIGAIGGRDDRRRLAPTGVGAPSPFRLTPSLRSWRLKPSPAGRGKTGRRTMSKIMLRSVRRTRAMARNWRRDRVNPRYLQGLGHAIAHGETRIAWAFGMTEEAWPQTQNGGPRTAAARRCGEDRSDQPPVFSTWLYSRSTGVGRPKIDTATRRRALSSSTLST